MVRIPYHSVRIVLAVAFASALLPACKKYVPTFPTYSETIPETRESSSDPRSDSHGPQNPKNDDNFQPWSYENPFASAGVIATAGINSATIIFSPPVRNADQILYYKIESRPHTEEYSTNGSPFIIDDLTPGVPYCFILTPVYGEEDSYGPSTSSNCVIPLSNDTSGSATSFVSGNPYTCANCSASGNESYYFSPGSLVNLDANTDGEGDFSSCTISQGQLPAGLALGGNCSITGTLRSQNTVHVFEVTGVAGNGSTSAASVKIITTNLTAVGEKFSCSIWNGYAKCWGDNSDNQFGDGGNITPINHLPVNVNFATNDIISIAAGKSHACAINTSKKVHCWGKNDHGQLGLGHGWNAASPGEVQGINQAWVVTANGNSTCVIDSGQLKCWGENNNGKLGVGDTNDRNVPAVVNISNGTVKSVSIGENHACAIENDQVSCWGSNTNLQLGIDGFINQYLTPVTTGLTGIQSVTAGSSVTCSLSLSGSVNCWGLKKLIGANFSSGTTDTGYAPTGLTSNVHAISASNKHICAVQQDSIFCWGDNDFGQLGNDSMVKSLVPIAVYETGISAGKRTSLTVGYSNTCAYFEYENNPRCWGNNNFGQIGNGTIAQTWTPGLKLNSSSTNSAIATSPNKTSCAIDGGKVYCWGSNNNGMLGGTASGNSMLPVMIQGLNSASKISLGKTHGCAIQSSSIYCWGFNVDGNNIQNSTPIQKGSSGASEIATGDGFSCGIFSSGGVMCWGKNTDGQLGNNSFLTSTTPAVATGLTSNVSKISANDKMVCAVVNFRIKCWGAGYLGTTSGFDTRNYPDYVSGIDGLNVKAYDVAVGRNHVCARVTESVSSINVPKIKCWGDNSFGQLGVISGVSPLYESAIPVDATQVTDTAITKISSNMASDATCVVANNSTKCWGRNAFGELGTANPPGVQTYGSSAVISSGVTDFSFSESHSCAVKSGSVYCSGMNEYGQLGFNQGLALEPMLVNP